MDSDLKNIINFLEKKNKNKLYIFLQEIYQKNDYISNLNFLLFFVEKSKKYFSNDQLTEILYNGIEILLLGHEDKENFTKTFEKILEINSSTEIRKLHCNFIKKIIDNTSQLNIKLQNI